MGYGKSPGIGIFTQASRGDPGKLEIDLTPMTEKEKVSVRWGPGLPPTESRTASHHQESAVQSNEPDRLRSTICQILDLLDFREVEVQGLDCTNHMFISTGNEESTGREAAPEGRVGQLPYLSSP